jgi:iron complex transport system substrate-binding protein
MKKNGLFVIAIILFLGFGCKQPAREKVNSETVIHPKYAKGFYISKSGEYTEAFVKDPWDSTKILAHYVFVPKNQRTSMSVSGAKIIRVPCATAACLSSPEIGFISRLGLAKNITGISQKEYIKDAQVLNQIASGQTIDLGPFERYNTERLMALNPDVLFAAPFEDDKYGKIRQTTIPIAYCSSYMEESPLGRAEWIKFIALFYDKYDQACAIFDTIAQNYENASKIARNIQQKPGVFSGKMYQTTWFVSGLNSYMARFFTDAGARYSWDDLTFSGSKPVSFERVYERCNATDYWVVLEYAPDGYSYTKLKLENERYQNFKAFKQRNIIFCNTDLSAYYEKGIIEPDVILRDFIALFHPELLPGYQPTYFSRLTHE